MDALFDDKINFSLHFNYCDKLIFFLKNSLIYNLNVPILTK